MSYIVADLTDVRNYIRLQGHYRVILSIITFDSSYQSLGSVSVGSPRLRAPPQYRVTKWERLRGFPRCCGGGASPKAHLCTMRTNINIVVADQLHIPVVKSMTEWAPHTSFLMLVSVGFQAVWLTGMLCISSIH